jgi:hypothetical protein
MLAELVGESRGSRQLEQILTRAATVPRPPPILLHGESSMRWTKR